jgi:hypothetical protein
LIFTPSGFGFGILPKKYSVIEDIRTSEFWVRKIPDSDRVLMSNNEIASFNRGTRNRQLEDCLDPALKQGEVTGETIQNAINVKGFPQQPLYYHGQQVKSCFYDDLLQEMDIKNIKRVNQVQFAYSIRGTSIRAFPTELFITDNPSDNEFDLFQETALGPAEPVIILHKSKSGKWFFVQASCCSGWVPATDLAVAAASEAWLNYLQAEPFLVVTGSRLRLGYNPYSPEISELEFMMGARIPLAVDEEIPKVIDNQSSEGCYVVKIPVREAEGKLHFKLALVPFVSDVSIGYLPYTREGVIKQAFKMQGERYGWGGLFHSRDCSSFVRDIYRCFGFQFPRNSREQMLIAGKKYSLDGASRQVRQRLLEQLSAGAILYFPGHVMLYLGKHREEYYVIHAIAYYGDQGRRDAEGSYLPVPLNAVAVSPLSLRRRRSGEELLIALTSALQIGPA